MVFCTCHLDIFVQVLTLAKRNWNSKSSLNHDEQRSALLNQFLERDKVEPEIYASIQEPDKVSRVPTQSEVDEILKPLRPEAFRKIAPHYNRGSGDARAYIYLRTYYGPQEAEDKQTMDDWLSDGGYGIPCLGDRTIWWQLLDDAEHFNFGRDWQLVYRILPELAVPSKYREAEPFEEMPFEEDVTFEEVLSDEFMFDQYLAYLATGTIMIIFDAEFFETNQAAVAFRDEKGNTVREGRIGKAEIQDLDTTMSLRGNLYEKAWFTEGVTGKKYKSMRAQQQPE